MVTKRKIVGVYRFNLLTKLSNTFNDYYIQTQIKACKPALKKYVAVYKENFF